MQEAYLACFNYYNLFFKHNILVKTSNLGLCLVIIIALIYAIMDLSGFKEDMKLLSIVILNIKHTFPALHHRNMSESIRT